MGLRDKTQQEQLQDIYNEEINSEVEAFNAPVDPELQVPLEDARDTLAELQEVNIPEVPTETIQEPIQLSPQQQLLEEYKKRKQELNQQRQEGLGRSRDVDMLEGILKSVQMMTTGAAGAKTGFHVPSRAEAINLKPFSQAAKSQAKPLVDPLNELMTQYKMLESKKKGADVRRVGSKLVQINSDGSLEEIYKDPDAQRRLDLSEQRLGLGRQKEGRLSEGQIRKYEEKDELSDKQTEQLAGYTETESMIDRIKKLKSKVKTGPVESRLKSAAEAVLGDEGTNPDFIALKQLVGTNLANYVKSISGSAVSEAEAQRLLKNIPDINDDDKAFARKVKEFEKTLANAKSIRIKSFKKQGKDPKAFEKVFLKKKQDDPNIATYAEKHGLTYENAEKILKGRGYGRK